LRVKTNDFQAVNRIRDHWIPKPFFSVSPWPSNCQKLVQKLAYWVSGSAHREGNSAGGLPLFNVGIRNRRGCHERQSFCPSWESNPGLRIQSPVRYPLGYRFTLNPKPCALSTRQLLDRWLTVGIDCWCSLSDRKTDHAQNTSGRRLPQHW